MSKKNSRYNLSLFKKINFMFIKRICILNDFKNNVKRIKTQNFIGPILVIFI